jgi:hypothetical protein
MDPMANLNLQKHEHWHFWIPNSRHEDFSFNVQRKLVFSGVHGVYMLVEPGFE